MGLGDSLRRLERALVNEGGQLWRDAVFGGEPAEVTWPADLPALTADLREWFAWRPAHAEEYSGTAWYRSAAWAAEEHRARVTEPGFVASLVPVCEGRYLDVRDDSIWVREIDDEGVDTFVRTEDRGLESVLSLVEAPYVARRGSPWRRLRVEATDEPWALLDRVPELAGTVGSVVLALAEVRGWLKGDAALDVGSSHTPFLCAPFRAKRPFDEESATEDIVRAYRYLFSDGDVSVEGLTEDEAGERLARALRARGAEAPSVRRSRLRVWEQPALDDLIARLPIALARIAPRVAGSFAPPATARELDGIALDIGLALPRDLRALWASTNGQTTREPFYWGFVLMSVEEARSTRASMIELAAQQMADAYWDHALVPFLDRGTGDALAVDVGGAYGPEGCVVDFDHERPERRRILYGSVTEWLECFVDGLEGGIYVADPDGGIFPRELVAEGSHEEIRRHEEARLNGRYPWERTLRELSRGRVATSTPEPRA